MQRRIMMRVLISPVLVLFGLGGAQTVQHSTAQLTVDGKLGDSYWQAVQANTLVPAQSGVPAARRHANVRGAFELRRSGLSVAVRTVVIVDDVCTTGATLEACARVLAAAGCGEIRALTAARAVRTPP